jgi:acyl-CoA thioester hydrolase
MEKENFKHKIIVTVRFHEVDMLGVCNNAVYINYFEQARLDYIKALGLVPKGGLFSDGRLFFIIKNEINYKSHARFDDELKVYSRISYIKNSSFGFDHLVLNKATGELIAEGSGVIAQVDPKTRRSTPLDEKFIDAVVNFEPGAEIIRQ